MYKLKEWICWFFLISSYLWSWGSVAACAFAPLILALSFGDFNPLWFLAYIVTIPAGLTTVILLGRR